MFRSLSLETYLLLSPLIQRQYEVCQNGQHMGHQAHKIPVMVWP